MKMGNRSLRKPKNISRGARVAALGAAAVAGLASVSPLWAATENDFQANTSMTSGANYSLGTPNNTHDVLITVPGNTLSITSASITMGSLNISNSNTYIITNNATSGGQNSALTLGGGGNVNSIAGSDPSDLIFLGGATSTLSINNGANKTLSLVLASSGNLDVSLSGASLTIGSAIGGAFSLAKTGAGILTLSGTNTFSGGAFTLASGTLNVNSAAALGSAAANTVYYNGGTIDNTSGGTVTLGNYAQVWNADINYAGTLNRSLTWGTGAVSLGTAAGVARTLTIGGSGTYTVGGVISNGTTANSIVKEGSGSLVLGGANAFTGGVTVNAGTLSMTAANAQTGNVVNGGTLSFGNAKSAGDGAITVNGGSLNSNAATSTNLALFSSAPTSITGTLTSNSATISMASTTGFAVGQAVTSANLPGGAYITAVGAGSITLNVRATNTSTNTVTTAASQTNAVFNADFTYAGTGPLALGAVSLGTNPGATRTISISGSSLSINGAITDGTDGVTPTVNLVKTGAGTLVLAGTSTYTGTTSILQGSVLLYRNAPTNAAGTLGLSTNQISLGDTSGSANTALLLSGTSGLSLGRAITVVSGNTGTATVGGNSSATFVSSNNQTISSTITLGTGTGDGHGLILTGNAGYVTNFTGVIQDGAGVTANYGNVTISNTGTRIALNANNTFKGDLVLLGAVMSAENSGAFGKGTIRFEGGGFNQGANQASNANNNAQVWNANWTFGSSSQAFGLNLGTGAVSLGTAAGSARTVTTNSTNGATDTLTVGGVISDGTTATGIVKAGSGRLLLGGASNYTGGTTISAGMLQLINGNNRLPTTTILAINAGASAGNAGARLDLNARSQEVAGLTAGSGLGFISTIGNTSTTAATLTVNNPNDSVYAGRIVAANTGAVSLTKTGVGAFTLSESQSMAGTVNVNGGTLIVQGGTVSSGSTSFSGLTWSATVSTITVGDTTAANLQVGQKLTNANLQGYTYITAVSGTTVSFNVASTNTSGTAVSGQTINVSAFNAAGLGTGSAVNVGAAGTLQLDSTGVLNPGQVVNVTGTLKGTGTASHVTTNPGGTITGGTGVTGELNVAGNLTIGAGHMAVSLAKAIAAAPPVVADYNQIDVIGASSTVALNNGDLVIAAGSGLEIGDTFYVLTNASSNAITGQFVTINGLAPTVHGDPGSLAQDGYFNVGLLEFQISYTGDAGTSAFSGGGNDIALQMTAVPEPGSLAVIGLAGAGLLARRRRRMK